MNDFDIPILKKSYTLYRTFHDYRKLVPKQDRYTVFERSEDMILDVIEHLLEAAHTQGSTKKKSLETASSHLNLLRFLVRLLKDIKSIDLKKYTALEEMIDEIGRMLGGWLRSSANSAQISMS